MSDQGKHNQLSGAPSSLMTSGDLLTYKTVYPHIEALVENARGWDCQYDQISSGRFSGSLLYAQVGPVQFSEVRWNRKMLFRGKGPNDAYIIEFPLVAGSGSRRFNGTEITDNCLIFQRPNKPGDFLAEEGRHGIALAISKDYFQAIHASLSDQRLEPEGQDSGIVRASDSVIAELRQTCRHYAQMVQQCLDSGSSEDTIPRAADQVAKLIVSGISQICGDGQENVYVQQSATLVAKAQEQIYSSQDKKIGLTEICQNLDVSLRKLNYAFKDATGETPAHWLRVHRLNGVRKMLLSEEGSKMLIKQVALEHGFLHLGRFSRQYKSLFGELPTDTVAARARSTQKAVLDALHQGFSRADRG